MKLKLYLILATESLYRNKSVVRKYRFFVKFRKTRYRTDMTTPTLDLGQGQRTP